VAFCLVRFSSLPVCLSAAPVSELCTVPDTPNAQQYKWATAAVASYSFILGDDQFQSMCPVWDVSGRGVDLSPGGPWSDRAPLVI